ncbi:Hexose transporter 2 [Fusarium oxysporum f. sp. albedinis]|nr:Hexose transporter 2 [Fusarium oxysporum f. sp. albedinis]
MPESSNEAKIILALQALQNDPKLSLRKAAAIYHSRLLSDKEEDTIVQFILDLDSRGFPSRLLYVEDIANSLRANRGAPPVGKRWAHNFIKRQLELKTHKFRRYNYQRAKCEDPTIIRGWFWLIENIIAKYSI